MRATIWTAVCLVSVCLGSARAGEMEDRQATYRHVSSLFEAEEFAELDRLAEKYRVEEARTGSGLWKLTLFYGGLYVPRGSDQPYDEAFIQGVEEKFLRWAAQNPESTVPRIGYASTLVQHAWFYRGNSFASKVRPEAWKPFRDYLAKARQYLLDHKQDAGIDPQWYDVMLDVAKGENWSQLAFQRLIDEAVAAHPYFYEIYFRAIDYLLPKWHGDLALIEEFADFAVEKTREKEGAGMYARVYWYASQAQYGTKLFTDTQVVWDKMAASIDDVLARYPDQWNINNFTHFACLAKDREKAQALIARIEGEPILTAWGRDAAAFGECQGWVTL